MDKLIAYRQEIDQLVIEKQQQTQLKIKNLA